ncbi:hypothetical protein K504DRAFT_301837 [Pleomassaria siparia CBS 279.74]|uniref:Uncharacterized protein n=1 Tax=Pleomassaria siparia CBS 279.74 TaxID=1314801 RepID=A0A6G1K5Y8_9PLEO|nr:hypothetical protein K504DRAFT_301837 [Pleomassaria siparia CBS 279.74]
MVPNCRATIQLHWSHASVEHPSPFLIGEKCVRGRHANKVIIGRVRYCTQCIRSTRYPVLSLSCQVCLLFLLLLLLLLLLPFRAPLPSSLDWACFKSHFTSTTDHDDP